MRFDRMDRFSSENSARPERKKRAWATFLPLIASMALLPMCQTLLAADTPTVDFGRQIQPILAKRCYSCHGPDTAEGGLRLDHRETALGKLDSGETAVIPGDTAKSELLRRIMSQDHSEQMPPEGARLSEGQVNLIKKWIEEGAKWEDHWAFVALKDHAVPSVKRAEWVKNPIDAFVLAKLEANGLEPAVATDKRALLRRVTYDLTGLPPTFQEVQDFLADSSPEAYEKVVDRLLKSPHFGERWARHWLDVVRYADTNSFERDGPKPFAWRYRDYVIRSFNDDKPYNQFIKEQLAGDEMPGRNPDALIATGYYRLGLWDDEPADRLQAKYDVLDDVVATTGQVFLGLTINCARCHDHKIDPLPQSDYYSMLAFFHGISTNPNSVKEFFTSEEEEKAYRQKVAALEAERNAVQTEISQIEQAFREAAVGTSDKPENKNSQAEGGDIDELHYKFYRDTFQSLPKFDSLKHESEGTLPQGLFDIRPATREDDFGFVFEGVLKVPQDGMYQFLLDSDDGSRLIIDGNAILTYDGIHGTGTPKLVSIKLTAGRHPIRLEYFQGKFGKGLSVAWMGPGFAQRALAFTDGKKLTFAELIAIGGEQILGAERFQRYKELQKQIAELKQKRITADQAMCVVEENPGKVETVVFKRGNPHSPGEKVEPGFPAVLASAKPVITAKDGNPGRRTALAEWIASGDNRLTSRVIVNRLWQHHFGRGIVRSTNNFGLLGDRPTHPEMLDYLAQQLVAGGWKLKPLHKMMVMSNAYRMSSTMNKAAYDKDPLNDLMWRSEVRRLSAEEVRDSLYAVTGQLNSTMYGPGFFPDISAEVMAGQSNPGQGWGKSSAEEQARRSIYIHVKRSLITPILADFDFAETDSSCAARFATTQPAQALGMLNGKFANDQSNALAARLLKEAGENPDAQIRLAYQLVLERNPTEKELASGQKLLQRLSTEHKQSPERCRQLFCLMMLNLNEFIYLD